MLLSLDRRRNALQAWQETGVFMGTNRPEPDIWNSLSGSSALASHNQGTNGFDGGAEDFRIVCRSSSNFSVGGHPGNGTLP
jgi:hypothetical protein